MVSLADLSFEDQIPVGALWALCGSMLYALYLVSLRRRVDHEDKLDITMFFGKSLVNFTFCFHFYVFCDACIRFHQNENYFMINQQRITPKEKTYNIHEFSLKKMATF